MRNLSCGSFTVTRRFLLFGYWRFHAVGATVWRSSCVHEHHDSEAIGSDRSTSSNVLRVSLVEVAFHDLRLKFSSYRRWVTWFAGNHQQTKINNREHENLAFLERYIPPIL